MNGIINRRRYMGKHGPLPGGYKLAEYVENTANLCLFTGLYATSELEMRIDFELHDHTASDQTLTLAANGYNAKVLYIWRERGEMQIGFGGLSYSVAWDAERHVVEWSGKMVELDGRTVIDGSSQSFGPSEYGSEDRSISLFGGRASNGNYVHSSRYCRARIYGLTINGHEFLPCYSVKEQSWGLYDTTARRFLFNKTALTGKLI